MKRRTESIIFLLTLCAVILALVWAIATSPAAEPLPATPAVCPPRGLTLDGRIQRVIDGDTVIVETLIVYRVRLLDCWAPESRGGTPATKRRGLASKQNLVALAGGRAVRVHVPSTGSLSDIVTFDRVLGHVWLMRDDGAPQPQSVNAQQVAAGFATTEKPPK